MRPFATLRHVGMPPKATSGSGSPVPSTATKPVGKERTLDEWKALARSRLGAVEESAAAEYHDVADHASQTTFGDPTKDQSVATVISTADLSRLIPQPDASTLMRSTLPSLRRAERDAVTLLEHVQRDLAYHLQDAGVSYDASAFDEVRQKGRSFEDTASGFTSRRQLRFKGSATSAVAAAAAQGGTTAPAAKNYWDFASHHDDVNLYNNDTLRRARVVEHLADSLQHRLKTYNEMEAQLAEQLAVSRTFVTAASLEREQMPSRYAGAAPGSAPTR